MRPADDGLLGLLTLATTRGAIRGGNSGFRRFGAYYDSGYLFWFAISPDGQLALARGAETKDVVLIKGFR